MRSSSQLSAPILTRRRLGLAGVAAFIGCAACCAMPLLVATSLGSGIFGALSAVFRPGHELFVGGAVFVIALGTMAIRSWLRKGAAGGCGSMCAADGSCCARGAQMVRE